jgi:hypothetical protein
VKYGPVDVVVLATGSPHFEGAILSELQRLAGQGTVRVLDAMLIVKAADGAVHGIDIEDLPEAEKAELGFIDTKTRGLFDAQDSATLAEGMVPGSAIVALAIENTWALGLMDAAVAMGAEVAFTSRIPAALVEDALAAAAAGAE